MKKRNILLITIIVLLAALPVFFLVRNQNKIKDLMQEHKESTGARAVFFIDASTDQKYIVHQIYDDVLYRYPKDIPSSDTDTLGFIEIIRRTRRCQQASELNVFSVFCPVVIDRAMVGVLGATHSNFNNDFDTQIGSDVKAKFQLSLDRLAKNVGFLY